MLLCLWLREVAAVDPLINLFLYVLYKCFQKLSDVTKTSTFFPSFNSSLFISSILSAPLALSLSYPPTHTHKTDTAYVRWLHEEESHDDAQLQQNEEEGNDELSAGRHEARFLRTDLLLTACQNPSNPVCLGWDSKHSEGIYIDYTVYWIQPYMMYILAICSLCISTLSLGLRHIGSEKLLLLVYRKKNTAQ